jgi:predicted aspartyl protease
MGHLASASTEAARALIMAAWRNGLTERHMTRHFQTVVLLVGLSVLMLRPAYPESIPLKLEWGTYVVPVLINGTITLDFTVDSGAAEVSIPADVFGTLRRSGTMSDSDLLEPGKYMLADGSVRKQPRFRIRTLKVGHLELRNVVASVAPAQGSLLLGQSFLSRVGTVSVDNHRHVLVLNEGIASAPISKRPPTNVSRERTSKRAYCFAHPTICDPDSSRWGNASAPISKPVPHENEVSPEPPQVAHEPEVSAERYAMAKDMCLYVSTQVANPFHCFDLKAEDVIKLEGICKLIDSDIIRSGAGRLVSICNLMDAVKPSTQ